MNEYHIHYWSRCGSIEVAHMVIRARDPLTAIERFKEGLKKRHPNMVFEYECYNPPVLYGDMHT